MLSFALVEVANWLRNKRCPQVLDPCDGESWEDPPGRFIYSFGTCCPGDVTCAVPSHTLNPESPEVHAEDPLSSGAPDLLREAASGVPASPEAEDVDMPPAEPGGGWPRLSGAPEDWRMAEEWPTVAGPPLPATEPAEPGRHTPRRTPGSRPPPRLRSEKDRGPKLTVSKRKLELLLAEPEKSKRKRRCAAQTQVSGVGPSQRQWTRVLCVSSVRRARRPPVC